MRRTVANFLVATAIVVGIFPPPCPACTFCGGGLANRQTLGENYRNSKVVLHGKLRNPRVDPSGNGGTTDFYIETVLKADPRLTSGRTIVLPRYYPVIGDTPTEYVLFGAIADGNFDPVFAVPATPAVVAYLRAEATVPAGDSARKLGFAFGHLGNADPTVSGDAFLEFAKATDAEILKAKAILDPAKLRKWLADPDTPSDRLGVYGLLLGSCGEPADATTLGTMVAGPFPLPERVASNLGGLLAGLLILDPKAGWSATTATLTDPGRPFNERLAAVGTVRFAQSTRPDAKPAVLGCYRAVIRQGELADLAIDDLRRWGWWELTADVLAKYEAVPPSPPVVRRGVVRYAIGCPAEEAKQFLEAARRSDPKLIADVEESVRLFGLK